MNLTKKLHNNSNNYNYQYHYPRH